MRRGYVEWDKRFNKFDKGLGNFLIIGNKLLIEIAKA